MRRALFVLVALLLIGCGSASSVITPTVVVSPAANVAATTTRDAELAQIATLSAPTARPAATPTIAATPTPLAVMDTPVPALPTATVVDTPIPPTQPPPATVTAAAPTFIALPTTSGGEFVTVLDDGTGQNVNIRILPSMSANIVRQARAGDDLSLHSTTPVSAEGWDWWQISSDHGGVAYMRADLVSAPHRPSTPTAVISQRKPLAQRPPLSEYPQIDERDLSKGPSRYEGSKFCMMGITFNVLESSGATLLQVYPTLPYSTSTGEAYEYPISVTYPGTLPGLYKDMRIVVFGTGQGVYTFSNQVGGRVSQPLVSADYIETIGPSQLANARATVPCIPPER